MTVASKAEHVGVAEAFVGRVAKLRQLEVRRVRRESLAAAVVDEQYSGAVPRHPPESLTTATVSLDLRWVDAIGGNDEAARSGAVAEAADTPLPRVAERESCGGSYGRLRKGPVLGAAATGREPNPNNRRANQEETAHASCLRLRR